MVAVGGMQLQPVLVVGVGVSLISSKQYRSESSSLNSGMDGSLGPVYGFGGCSYRSAQKK